jgi:hypothetical protein
LIELRHGNIADPELQQWVTEVDRLFINNYGDVMGHRSDPRRTGDTVDAKIAALFANMKAGAVMVTLSPIDELGATNKEVVEERAKHKLVPSNENASFFALEEFTLGPANQCVTWSQGSGKADPLVVYKYTRLGQADDSLGPVILCTQSKCEWAKNATPILAKTLKGGALVMNLNGCKCSRSMRRLRGRK